ncbi:hypothetical protein [Natrinema sp. SYSU A 869]|uniref:hypothetical protein n=1 Tax=Natrinema sp. SYSU A 869 TaxID=2871694 RepID=UPI001CA400D4|nr:hypothetical protein [Natrinema sp. SYSU A 869]
MYEVSRELLYAIVGIPILAVVGYVLVVLLAFNLVGFLALGIFLLLLALAMDSLNADSEPPARINCSECGAPNETDRDRCTHCDATLDTVDET